MVMRTDSYDNGPESDELFGADIPLEACVRCTRTIVVQRYGSANQ